MNPKVMAPKRESIAAKLRRQIVAGSIRPGQQLPTRSELEQRFRVSSLTVQLALDRLAEDGFIRADGRRGTFVADAPPHLHRYALVFPSYPNRASDWSRFWTALSSEALNLQEKSLRRVAIYHGVTGSGNSEDYRRLAEDVRLQRLAGVVFAAPPFFLAGTPVLKDRSLSRVAIMDKPDWDSAAVRLDHDSFLSKAFDRFVRQGRRKVALLTVPGLPALFHRQIGELLAARDLETRPYWMQAVNQATPETACNLVHLLMQGVERPDALLIADDNLVEHATAGLVAAGVRVPDELEVVAHCNFPHPTPSILPVRRLGYDAREVMKACVESIDLQRRSGKAAPTVSIQAVFEDEIVTWDRGAASGAGS